MRRIRRRYTYRLFLVLAGFAVLTLAIGGVVGVRAATAAVGTPATVAALLYLFLLHVGLLGIVLGGDVAMEVRRLTTVTERIGAGDLDVDPTSHRPDEIGRLADGLDAMRASLREAFEESDAARAEAEQAHREIREHNRALLEDADAIGDAMAAVSAGDLTRRLEPGAEAEAIDRIMDAYDDMTVKLSETLGRVQGFVDTVERTATEVADAADDVAGDQRELADEMRAVAEAMTEEVRSLEDAAAAVTDVSATFEEVASMTADAADRSTSGHEVAAEGTQRAREIVAAIRDVESSVSRLGALVDRLDDRMAAVGETTELIGDIAAQTDMIALNANIEAGRVDRGGDGFGVVAEEIRALSEEIQGSTVEIEDVLGAIQADVADVTDGMDATRDRIDASAETVEEARRTFERLNEIASDIDAATADIAQATDDGAESAERVAATVDAVTETVRSVADRTHRLAATAEETAETMDDLRAGADTLTTQTADLAELLGGFEPRADVLDEVDPRDDVGAAEQGEVVSDD